MAGIKLADMAALQSANKKTQPSNVDKDPIPVKGKLKKDSNRALMVDVSLRDELKIASVKLHEPMQTLVERFLREKLEELKRNGLL